jgi:hypothetical protein
MARFARLQDATGTGVQLNPYLQQGWAFVAMRLTGSVPLNGQLAPVQLVFGSDQLIYPMRMSAAARTPLQVLIYTLGAHKMQRIDPDKGTQNDDVPYAGSIAGRSHDQTLTELAGHGPFLTRMSAIVYPERITSDFVFGPAPDDDPYPPIVQQTPYGGQQNHPAVQQNQSPAVQQNQSKDMTPMWIVVGSAIAIVAVAVALIVLIVRSRRRSRSAAR